MVIEFKPAKFERQALLIGLAGGTGSGKTYSGMEVATGISEGKRFAVVDTENNRALHYARDFAFDHATIAEPFTPEAYIDAITAADRAGYPAIVVDSMSHEWAGDGGILDWHDAELDRMVKDPTDYQKRDACSRAAWIKPKKAHKQFVQKLLQVRAHLILCFRAEEKIDQVKVEGKWKFVPMKSPIGRDGWIPITDKRLPFELTLSLLLINDRPGCPHPIKLEGQHQALVPLDKPLTRATGAAMARWAAGEEDPMPTVDGALKAYAECKDRATFEKLEATRTDGWSVFTRAQKISLKAASEAAAARLKERAAPEPLNSIQLTAQGIDAIKACTTVEAAHAAYVRYAEPLSRLGGVPVELEGTLQDRLAAIKAAKDGF